MFRHLGINVSLIVSIILILTLCVTEDKAGVLLRNFKSRRMIMEELEAEEKAVKARNNINPTNATGDLNENSKSQVKGTGNVLNLSNKTVNLGSSSEERKNNSKLSSTNQTKNGSKVNPKKKTNTSKHPKSTVIPKTSNKKAIISQTKSTPVVGKVESEGISSKNQTSVAENLQKAQNDSKRANPTISVTVSVAVSRENGSELINSVSEFIESVSGINLTTGSSKTPETVKLSEVLDNKLEDDKVGGNFSLKNHTSDLKSQVNTSTVVDQMNEKNETNISKRNKNVTSEEFGKTLNKTEPIKVENNRSSNDPASTSVHLQDNNSTFIADSSELKTPVSTGSIHNENSEELINLPDNFKKNSHDAVRAEPLLNEKAGNVSGANKTVTETKNISLTTENFQSVKSKDILKNVSENKTTQGVLDTDIIPIDQPVNQSATNDIAKENTDVPLSAETDDQDQVNELVANLTEIVQSMSDQEIINLEPENEDHPANQSEKNAIMKINAKKEKIESAAMSVNSDHSPDERPIIPTESDLVSSGINFIVNSEVAKNAAIAMEVFNLSDSSLTDHVIEDSDLHSFIDLMMPPASPDDQKFSEDSNMTDSMKLATSNSAESSSEAQHLNSTFDTSGKKNESSVVYVENKTELVVEPVTNATLDVTDIASERKCPAPSICLFWFMARDTCSNHSQCPGEKLCCRVRCSKNCIDV